MPAELDPSNKMNHQARWVLYPTVLVCLCWFAYLQPNTVTSIVPPIMPYSNRSVDTVFPIQFTNPEQIMKFGILESKLEDATDPVKIKNITQSIAALFGQTDISEAEINYAHKLIMDANTAGLWSKIFGILTFVNFLWLLGIGLILITCGPSLEIIVKPLFIMGWHLIRVFHKVFSPYYDVFGYALCYLFIVQGLRYEPTVGLFVSLGGSLGIPIVFTFSTEMHIEKQVKPRYDQFTQVLATVCCLSWAPMAILYQSTLYGYMTVIAFYSLIGFSVMCFGLMWVIGFENDEGMNRVAFTSVYMIFLTVFLRNSGLSHEATQLFAPFVGAINVFGCLTYLLAVLIKASRFSIKRGDSYFTPQLKMIVSLVTLILVGNVMNMPSMTNTAYTFVFLYIMEKTCEQEFWFEQGTIFVLFFIVGIVLYLVSLFLSTHPGWIATMFDSSAIITAHN